MWAYLRLRITLWVILGAIATAGGLIFLLAGFLFVFARSARTEAPAPALTFIPAPTLTPVLKTATPGGPQATPTGQTVDGISVGMYVQISGTGGDGLRLRAGPGKGNAPRFLGYEAEVFHVKDGPKSADGLTWWYLEAPYDPGRSGWAAADFLTVVAAPR